MMKKVLMITIYLVVGYQAQASYLQPASLRSLASERNTANTGSICTIQAGDIGSLKYKGQSYEEAFSKVTNECFERRNQKYIQAKSMQPAQDRQIQFVEACANSVKCI